MTLCTTKLSEVIVLLYVKVLTDHKEVNLLIDVVFPGCLGDFSTDRICSHSLVSVNQSYPSKG